MTTAEKNPHPLRVLVTRPEGRADALMAALAALGDEAVHIPLLAVAALDAVQDVGIIAATAQQFRALDTYDRVIAISVNALHFGMPWIEKYWPALPSRCVWYGIGVATIAAFAERGISARGGSGAMTSEALLALPDLQQLRGERILILRGVGGREQLATVLRERGAVVEYAECYRRIEPVLTAAQRAQLQAMAFDAICVNSNETLQNLWQCLTPAAQHIARNRVLIAPSARVAQAANDLGFARVIAADNAGTAATLAALMRLRA